MGERKRFGAQELRLAAALVLLALAGGCGIFAVAAQALPPPPIPPKYVGLQDQSVAVMVWVDPAIAISYPRLQLDLATSIQSKLNPADKKKLPKDLKGTTFPVLPASVIRFQYDRPELADASAADLAPSLTTTRLIYAEVDDFGTRSDVSGELFRGNCTGGMKVIEVVDRQGKEAYSETGLSASFPPKSPQEGVLGATDIKIYAGTVDAFAQQVVNRLVTQYPEEW